MHFIMWSLINLAMLKEGFSGDYMNEHWLILQCERQGERMRRGGGEGGRQTSDLGFAVTQETVCNGETLLY